MDRGIRTDSEGNVYVGEHLKHFRNLLRITQLKMAMDLGVTQKQISFWESELQPMPRYFIKQLVAVYGSKSINLVQAYRDKEESYYETM